MGHGPELAERMVDEGDGGALGWRNGPTAAEEVDLEVGIDPAAQMERQMQIQKGGGRTRPDGRALLRQGFGPSGIGTQAGGAADGGILVGDLAIQDDLSGRVIADVFIGQQRHQTLLQGSETTFDFAFGLRAGGDQMGHAQGGEGALELGTGIPIIGQGIMAKEAQAVGIDDQRQGVLEKEPAKMLEVIPSGVGGDEDRAQEFSRMIIHGQQQGLFGGGRPPLVAGGVVLPKFAQPGAFPAATGLGAWGGRADEVGEMGADKGGDGLPMSLETEAAGQLIGYELKVGRGLQRDKLFEELAGFRWPSGPVAATGESRAERRAVL